MQSVSTIVLYSFLRNFCNDYNLNYNTIIKQFHTYVYEQQKITYESDSGSIVESDED